MYSSLQYSTVQYSTVRYSTVQYLALVHPGVPHPQHPHPQLPDAGQGVEVYRVSGVGGEHDGVVAQDVDVVRGSPHPGDLIRSWLLVCHESKCVNFDASYYIFIPWALPCKFNTFYTLVLIPQPSDLYLASRVTQH